MKKKRIVPLAVAALALSLGAANALAAETESAYSYLTGQKNSTARNELYAQAEALPEDERAAFLAEHGIAETPYSEEAAAAYGYVTGQEKGAQYEDDTEDKSDYAYVAGQEAGASHAPEAEAEDAYSYLTGQKNSAARNELYAQAEALPEDERAAFLAEHGIAETPYSEEAAAAYGYVTGQEKGAQYEDDTEDKSDYSYVEGARRGASYHKV